MSSADDARLADLESRLAALEELSPTDTLSPNYLTLNADGSVGATFSGLINAAQGVTIPSSASKTSINAIQWIRASDGAAVATIDGQNPNPASGTSLELVAEGPDRNKVARLTLNGNNPGAQQSSVSVNAGAIAKTLLAADGTSDYVQLAGGTSKLLLQGADIGVNLTAGAVGAPAATNFTCAALGGINFPNACLAVVGTVRAGAAWPSYYGFQPGPGGTVNVFLSSAASGIYGVDWIAIGN